MTRKDHWESIYSSKGSEEVSWYQREPRTSLRMIDLTSPPPECCIIDVGGGDSRLVDVLVDRGFTCLTVLDVSGGALARAKARLGDRHQRVRWIENDVTAAWDAQPVDIWHDRAMFHFLVDAEDRRRYLQRLQTVLKPGGHAIIGTFSLQGPEKCSGLPVMRYSAVTLATELGPGFTLITSIDDDHITPAGRTQAFGYALFRSRA